MANGKWQMANGRTKPARLALLIVFTFTICHFPFAMTPPSASAAPRVLSLDGHKLRIVKTRHYELHTDLDPGLVVDLTKRMDSMYEEYSRRLSEFHPPADAPALPVYLFNRQADYMALMGPGGANSSGRFVVTKDGAFLAAFLENEGRDNLRRTLQHEAFHQFAFFAISQNLPIWLNEGLAQFFQEGLWTGNSFWIGQVPPRMLWDLQERIKKHELIEFKKFLAVTDQDWSKTLAKNLDTGDIYYTQSWAMVHFLVQSGQADYRTRLINYLKRLHNGENPDTAFEQAFSKNIQGFQDHFAQWIVNLQPTPEATIMHRQEWLADYLLKVDPGNQKFRDVAAYRNHMIANYMKGDGEHSEMIQTYFSDVLGRLYSDRELYFQNSSNSTMPDIVCRASPQYQFRTHYYQLDSKTVHETLIEPTDR
jgi:hypothetical protein